MERSDDRNYRGAAYSRPPNHLRDYQHDQELPGELRAEVHGVRCGGRGRRLMNTATGITDRDVSVAGVLLSALTFLEVLSYNKPAAKTTYTYFNSLSI